MVAPNPFEGIAIGLIGFGLAKFRFGILKSPFAIGMGFIAEAVPAG